MRPATTTVGEDARELNGTVEAEATILEDINPVRLVVSGSVDNRDITTLDKVARDEEVLLVGGDLDIVRADDGLVLVGVVQALDVGEVRDVQGCDVVALGNGEVCELSVVGNVRVDGNVVLGFGAQVPEELGNALVSGGVGAEGIDDPDLAKSNGTGIC